MQINRTFLFAPGNHPRKVEKVFGAGADAVILDLEDAVAVSEKPATRAVVVAALAAPRSCRGYIRINDLATPFAFEDIEAVVQAGVDGVILPKVERPDDVRMVDWMMTSLERKRGLAPGGIDLVPIIETARGMAAVREIAASGVARMRRLSFGAGDYTRDLAMDWSLAEDELLPARSEVVLASRAAGIEPPIDTVFIHLKEEAALAASARLVKRLGFQGKLCIHPAQVGIVNDVFTPGADEVAWARRIVEAFAEAEKAGSASIQVDGYFVDYPIVEKARRIVAVAEAIGG